MEIKLNFGQAPFVLPSLTGQEILALDGLALRLLVLVASDKSYRNADKGVLAEALGITPARLEKPLGELVAAGLLSIDEEKQPSAEIHTPPKAEAHATEKKSRVSELPSYTDEELSGLLEKHGELGDLITEAQNTFGKIFTVSETKILVSIAEEFGFDEEFLLVLLDFCRRDGRKSMRYVEKLATSLYDGDIRTTAALTEYLHRKEAREAAEGRIRGIFGIGSRALTSKEKEYIAKWTETYGMSADMVERAYEITVDTTSKPSFSYANKILESWYAGGIRTPADVDAAQAERKGQKTGGMSFDVDDFFRAALDRSYRDEDKKG